MLNMPLRRKDWQEYAIQLLDYYRLLTAEELTRLLELYNIKIRRSSVYSFLKGDPLIKYSTVLKGSKVRLYRIGKPLPTEEAYSTFLHNEYFIMKLGIKISKPTTETSINVYMQNRFDQLEQQNEKASPLLRLEWGTAHYNLLQQKKMITPSAPANLYCTVKHNKIGFICIKEVNTWVIYDTPLTTKEAINRKLEMLQKSVDVDYYGDLSYNVMILSFDKQKIERFIKPFRSKGGSLKVSVVSPQ